jgi:hypothetical protein
MKQFLLAFMVVLGARVFTQSPAVPHIESGACPFEGCIYREWRAKALVIAYESRERRIRVFTVQRGEVVTAITGDVITTMPGRARIKGDEAIAYLLTSHGEGEYTAWIRGALSSINISRFKQPDVRGAGYSACVQFDICEGEVLTYPKYTWWVQIRNARGQIGWTNRPVDFDCKDALGGTCQ